MSRTVPGLEDHLNLIEDSIQLDLILALLGCTVEEAAKPDFWNLLDKGVKRGDLNLRNLVVAAPWQRQGLVEATPVLVDSLLDGMNLDTVEHREIVIEARRKNKKKRVNRA